MNQNRKTKYTIALLSTIGFTMISGSGLFPTEKAYAEKISVEKKVKKEKSLSKEQAEKLLYQAPDATPLTKEGEADLKEHYVEKYMPVEGCSLVEELPKTSNIHYSPPKPKPKPKPKVKPKAPSKPKVTIQKEVAETKKAVKPVKVSEKQLPEKKEVSEPAILSAESIQMTTEERLWLERLVEAESGGEPYEGRVAVATVIANRVSMPEFPGTVMEVITAPKQFSPFIDGSVHKKTPSAETKRAVAEVFDKGVRTLPSDTAYFCTTAIASNSWIGQTRPFVKTIGNHSFYLK